MGTPVSSTNKTDLRDIAENIVESGVKHDNPNTNLEGSKDKIELYFCPVFQNRVRMEIQIY